MKGDLKDTEKALIEDTKFLADLKKNCGTKEAEWEETKKIRSEEILALADTIKLLNSDDALELFKKALPGSASLLQLEASKSRALSIIREARGHHPQLDLIALA